jgi:hypothetical protein
MAFQVAFAWSDRSEAELKSLGFEKREVYMKSAPYGPPIGGDETHTDMQKRLGDQEFFKMLHPPFQFCTTSFWGAMVE